MLPSFMCVCACGIPASLLDEGPESPRELTGGMESLTEVKDGLSLLSTLALGPQLLLGVSNAAHTYSLGRALGWHQPQSTSH